MEITTKRSRAEGGVGYLFEATHRVRIVPLSHGNGFNLIERAAEISGSIISEHRTGETFDYSDRRQDVLYFASVTPTGMTGVAWAKSSDSLWNQVTDGLGVPGEDNRIDLTAHLPSADPSSSGRQLAREYRMEIPGSVGLARGIELLKRHAVEVSDRYQTPVQFVIHRPDESNGAFPVYMISPTRQLEASGFGRTVIRDHPKGGETDRARFAGEVAWHEETWSALVNEALRSDKVASRADLPGWSRRLMAGAVREFRKLQSHMPRKRQESTQVQEDFNTPPQ